MKYVFEKGQYPNLTTEEDKEFSTDEEAIQYAKDNDFDYVWNCPEDRNPDSIWRKPYSESKIAQIKKDVNTFLEEIKNKREIRVICDETNNSEEDRVQRKLNVDVEIYNHPVLKKMMESGNV
jgi:hypothetical protein